jgi:transglutaminase superfamily protein
VPALRNSTEAFRPLPVTRKLGLIVEILRTYVRIRLWLWKRELPAILNATRAQGGPAVRTGDGGAYVNGLRLGRAVGRVLSPLPADSRCLVRSLVLSSLLSRRGIESSLVIGVRPKPDFGAHAWVEHEGKPLLRDEEHVYRRLVEFGPEGSAGALQAALKASAQEPHAA